MYISRNIIEQTTPNQNKILYIRFMYSFFVGRLMEYLLCEIL